MRTEKFVKKWERERKKGKRLYVLTTCILIGLGMFIGAVIGSLGTGGSFDTIDLIHIISALAGGLTGGAIGGILKWNYNEGKYNRFLSNDLHK